ncbi:hypothetical protein V6N12_005319 [Hibiscus sabdariffa]|uniref:Uncharacterized protein n=1 Tax=Hibiscus sabdariffa TaxID=183260 RepID=A0ABR2CP39_9ROSI
MLNRKDDKSTAVIISNPRSSDFEIYEVGDVVLLDEKKDVGASNHRLLVALYCGANSGFEVLNNFDISYPCSFLELNIEYFL